MAPKAQFDTRGESRRPDEGPKHRNLFSPFCKYCGDPIDWAEFRYDEETKVQPVTPHTFEQHGPICRKQPFKPRRIFTNPNAAKNYGDLMREENRRLKDNINNLETTAALNEKRIKELDNRLADFEATGRGDDVGSSELRDAIKTMGAMSVHVRDLAKSVQIILKNGFSSKLADVVPAKPEPVVEKPFVPAVPPRDAAADLAASRRAEIDEVKEKMFARIESGETVHAVASEMGVNLGVAGSWVDEAKRSGRIKGKTVDTVKLTDGARYKVEDKRRFLRDVIAGLSRSEMLQKHGVTAGTLMAIVDEANKNGLNVKVTRKYVKWNDVDKAKALDAVNSGRAVSAVAKDTGIPAVTIEFWLGLKDAKPKGLLNGHAAIAA